MWSVVVPALIALFGVIVAAWWQYGGYLSALRRRLNQELEALSKMPEGMGGRQDFQQHIEQLSRRYLGWARLPLRARLRQAFIPEGLQGGDLANLLIQFAMLILTIISLAVAVVLGLRK